jgi:hypothetical protein
MAITIPVDVEMEDGSKFSVNLDQRDLSAAEVEFSGTDINLLGVTGTRFSTWNAARRTGKIDKKMTWENFNDACINANADVEGFLALNPGTKDQPDASSSNWRSTTRFHSQTCYPTLAIPEI